MTKVRQLYPEARLRLMPSFHSVVPVRSLTVRPLAAYFIMNNRIYQSPDLYSILSNRLVRAPTPIAPTVYRGRDTPR